MTIPRSRIPPIVLQALEETGLPWTTELGGSHVKVRLAGRFVAILPRRIKRREGREVLNVTAQIRRAAQELSKE